MIVLFDGVCNLCNGVVRWIILRDASAHISFAALQSPTGQELAAQHGIDAHQLESLVVIDGLQVYTASTAALHICTALDWPWPLFSRLHIVPISWRDALYRVVARNRYRWFGKRDHCMIPTPEQIRRFL